MSNETQPKSNAPKNVTDFPAGESKPEEGYQASESASAADQQAADAVTLMQVQQHLQATLIALSLRAKTPAAQTERHALYDRIITAGGPLRVAGEPAWNIAEQVSVDEEAKRLMKAFSDASPTGCMWDELSDEAKAGWRAVAEAALDKK